MYQKLLFTVLIMGLFACSDRDLPYYQTHLDEAENKAKECDVKGQEAFKAKNEEQLKAIAEDPECKAAKRAHFEYKQQLAELKMKADLEKRQKKREQEKLKFAEEYEQHKIKMTSMDVESFFSFQKECSMSFKPSAQCKAFSELKEERAKVEIEALIKQYEGDELTKFNKNNCSGTSFNQVYCDLSRSAIAKQRTDEIDYYISNRDKLKTVFNECQAKYAQLRKSKKWDEAREYIQTFKCRIVADAAKKLKVYDFSKPIG